jgi:hypothetical protein
MAYAKTSLRGEQRALRERMRALGLSRRQIAVEFVRGYRLRPRAAWRHAYGWSLKEAAERISDYAARFGLDPDGATVAMTAPHLSEYENWPGPGTTPAGRRPTPYLLALLAGIYECAVHDLLDLPDYEHMPPADRLVIDKTAHAEVWQAAGGAVTPAAGVSRRRPGTPSSSPAVFSVFEEMVPAGVPGELTFWDPASPDSRHPAAISGRDTFPALEALDVTDLLTPGLRHDQEAEDPVRRRTFAGLASTSLLGGILDRASGQSALDAEPFVSVLTGHAASAGPEHDGPPSDAAALSAAARDARRQYQACRYSELISELPQLLARLQAACLSLEGEARRRVFALSADTYHVAAGLLLKLDDPGLAYLAADRSMRAALASEDPVTVGASARIITHALMSGSHLAAAVSTARSHAERLDRAVPSHTPASLSVYGSLLLRGAVAAAQHDQRAAAHELLDEADSAAQRLGVDGNLRWTAFGPTNARLHRVNVAVTLGDAGTAVDVARRIDLRTITVTERKAALLIDTARAYLQWGRHEKAYIALRAAEDIAHEEVAGRPSARRLVRQLVTSAPPTVRRDATRFAAGIGVSP